MGSVVKRGELKKRGQHHVLYPSWRLREFELRENLTLSYYSSKWVGYNMKKMGSFTLSSQSSIVSEDGFYFSIKNVQSEHCEKSVDVMLLSADDEDKQLWVDALNQLVASVPDCLGLPTSPEVVVPCNYVVRGIELSRDGLQLIVYGQRMVNGDLSAGVVSLWDRATWEPVAEHTFEDTKVVSVVVTPDGERVIVGCRNGDAHVLSCTGGSLVHLRTLALTSSRGDRILHSLGLTPGGNRLLILVHRERERRERVEVWDLSTYERLATMESPVDVEVGVAWWSGERMGRSSRRVCVTADGTRAVTVYTPYVGHGAGPVDPLNVWDLASNTLAGSMDVNGVFSSVLSLAASPTNPAWVVLAEGTGEYEHWRIRVLDVINLTQVHVIGKLWEPQCVRFSPDGAHILGLKESWTNQSLSTVRVVHMWDTTTWKKVQYMEHYDPPRPPTLPEYHSLRQSLTVSPDNAFVVASFAGHYWESGKSEVVVWRGLGSHVVPK